MRLNRHALTLIAGLLLAGGANAAPFTLTNGGGDGQLNVGVDGFGAFGSSAGGNTTNAIYNPVGATPPTAGTSYESAVAIRFGSSGARTILASGSIGGAGNLTNPSVTGTALAGTSTFSIGGLSFTLTQTLTDLVSGSTQTGTVLTQSYSMVNTTTGRLSFEMLRYLDGDLQFDGSLIDGGGRLFLGDGTEVLFETDSATGSAVSTTFVGITSEGGTVPTTGRFEIDSFSGLLSRVISGTALDNTITGDSVDPDQFIDAGNGYDVTLAMRNLFVLDAGASSVYTTRTFFGSGAPEEIPGGTVPVPGTLLLAGLGLLAAATLRRRA
jgi:hypothetical protein